MDKEKTGLLIKNARIENGYTQKDLGDLIGVSNKAVSRWENGDSFPDITLLDILASTLDLKIEEIVLGEKITASSNNAADELVKTVKLQEKEKTKNMIFGGIGILIIFNMILEGYNTFFGATFLNWPTEMYYYSFVIVLLFVTIKSVQEPNMSLRIKEKLPKHLCILTEVTGIYITLLTLIVMTLTINGITPFHIKLTSVGPFINNQLAVVFAINLICVVVYFYKNIKEEENITILMYLNIAVMHLALIYSDILHRITELDLSYFLVTFSINMGIISILSIAMILITNFVKKKVNTK